MNSGQAGMVPHDGRVVVVGGGLAGARVCSALRRKGLTGPIDVVAAETHLPYDRPPLSKDVLLGTRDATPLPFDVEKLDVTFHPGRRATGVSPEAHVLHTDAGDMAYDGLVIATGAGPVRLPGTGEQLTLRTIEDALAVRARLVPGSRVVIVGASWIGAEVATAALARGCRVTCVEYDETPLARTLGDQVARHLRPWWSDVDLRCRLAVQEVSDEGVVLADGQVLPADLVVVGIGVKPVIGWLDGSGIATGRGILTDERCRTGAPGVIAVGDVAERWSPRAGAHLLIEHWDDAGAAATTAAAALLQGDDAPAYDAVPYFWSDQFGHKVQYVGRHSADDDVAVTTDDDGNLATAEWRSADGSRTAWLGVDRPKEVVKARVSIGQPALAPTTS
ncbi:FAD-dependent oxidoreductase [Streptomyces carpinensis]|uniref:FAD-dependent oxidoreductase n=1 Tax=Streptomyces carpinensis TaxID=66369 RepID=A0ABV1VWH3_9ACTN|nr:FAD-dependent oxidoreductase [Streptomyces carpinensis]